MICIITFHRSGKLSSASTSDISAIAQAREKKNDDETFSHLWVTGIHEAVDWDGDQHGNHRQKNTKVPHIRIQSRAMTF